MTDGGTIDGRGGTGGGPAGTGAGAGRSPSTVVNGADAGGAARYGGGGSLVALLRAEG
jgi:hypothetical protein